MSRVGKAPIEFPKEVSVETQENQVIVKGPKGELVHPLPKGVQVEIQDNQLLVSSDDKALRGTTRAVLNNKVLGVTQGFRRKLLLVGIGYRAQVSKVNVKEEDEQGGKGGRSGGSTEHFKVDLTLGVSHPVSYLAPYGIELQSAAQTEIEVIGICKALVGQVAANIRGICKGIRKPEPYKGKGIRYSDERIILKETKKKK